MESIQYWIFDINYEDHKGCSYEKRYSLLVNAFHRYLEDNNGVLPTIFGIVPTNIARNHQEVVQYHNKYVSQGYEGLMIKKINNKYLPNTDEYNATLYKSGKCSNILKYKQFFDEEFTIIGIEQGKYYVRNQKFPNSFFVEAKGSRYNIGELLTVRYLGIDNYGVPINPIAIAIRDYE